MEKVGGGRASLFFEYLCTFLRKCLFSVLSVGPVPSHIAFIMDGNRRYAKRRSMVEGEGHKAGFSALMLMLRYCNELGIKHMTVCAFSIDNFKRRPEEVESLMDLILEKIEGLIKEDSIVNRYGMRVHFIGNLKLLSKPVREAAERAMVATTNNSKAALSICVAYTSTDEIVNAVQKSCEEKRSRSPHRVYDDQGIKLVDIEKHMYMGIAPDPDILIRTSGETRLSNFLRWQSVFLFVFSLCTLAGDWFQALGLGCAEFPEEPLLFGEEKEATLDKFPSYCFSTYLLFFTYCGIYLLLVYVGEFILVACNLK